MMEMLSGLTSVTFRNLSVDEIIALCVQAGLDGIEWGSDVHVPVGDLALAKQVKEKCHEQGIQILAYGSYYRGGDVAQFHDVLATAQAIGAKIIRIWAGYHVHPDEISDTQFNELVSNLTQAAVLAKEKGIALGFEYHRRTMSETLAGAKRLLDPLPMDNVFTYWQPNPDITYEQQLAELDALAPRLAHYHVFAWEKGNIRYPLAHGMNKWQNYIAHGAKHSYPSAAILEFVKDDKAEQFREDAAVLKQILADSMKC